MIWNPTWNESLYIVACAERIIDAYNPHSENEILTRIERNLKLEVNEITATHLQFQLILVQRKENKLQETVVFTSRIQKRLLGDI